MRTFALAGFILIHAAAAATATAPAAVPAYDREAIHFSSGRFELAGDLLTPRDGSPHPVIIYVWGSGPSNRNKHIDGSPVLKAFIEQGFAVLLYDKPGSGESTGEFDDRHLFAERASILMDAIAFLKRHRSVVPDAIGLYGSSQASYVMASALARSHDIAFVIAWSCPMENSVEQGAYLVRNYVLCDGGTAEDADAAESAYVRRGSARSYAEYRDAAEILDSIAAIRDGLGWAGVMSEAEFTPKEETSESFLDPGKTIGALDFPVLALYAENDRQIDPAQGAAAYRRLLADSHQPLSTVVMIPGADHNMNLSPRGCMQDQLDGYRNVGGKTLSPAFLSALTEWLTRLNVYLTTR
ncbi:MAG TPA: alpha/beta hydrolase [Candidatus Krumholzibacteria bacterium]|nr:alpha/beta hydrolase [Candidatus Krumholzibacteria bacterium]